jgi:hypothetical protein
MSPLRVAVCILAAGATLLLAHSAFAADPVCGLDAGDFQALRGTKVLVNCWALYDPQTCKGLPPGQFSVITAPEHGTVSVGVADVQLGPGSNNCSGKIVTAAVDYYTWTDSWVNSTKTPPTDHFTVGFTLPGQNHIYQNVDDYAIFYPQLSGPQLTTNGQVILWWFNGANPIGQDTPGDYIDTDYVFVTDLVEFGPNYPCQSPKDLTWQIKSGQGEVKLIVSQVGNFSTATLTSAAPSKKSKDIRITVSCAGSESPPAAVTVRAPYKLLKPPKFPDYCIGISQSGYYCRIYYETVDQLGRVLPKPIAINEAWTTDYIHVDTPSEKNWGRGPACGNTGKCPIQPPSHWFDAISTVEPGCPSPSPTSKSPCPKPPATKSAACDAPGLLIFDFPGKWSVGSQTSGKGVTVQTNTWSVYQNHGCHSNIASPP